MDYFAGEADVLVIGAGHAGIEAASGRRAAGLPARWSLPSIWTGWAIMPCNPSIGGTAKGHLVREIDALGGEMGKAADAAFHAERACSTGARARRCTACGPRSTGGPTAGI